MSAPNSDHLDDEHFHITAQALEASVDHPTSANPKMHLHMPAMGGHAKGLIERYFPQNYLEQIEANYHLGNYVIDRKTGERTFEEMSVR